MSRFKSRLVRLAWFVGFAIFVLPTINRAVQGQAAPAIKLARADTVVAYGQPAIYFKWWQEIAECEGLDLPLARIGYVQFFVVKAKDFWVAGSDVSYLGATLPRNEQIYLAAPFVLNERVVKHEMLHQALWWAGFNFGPWHPAEFFDVCGLVPWGS